MFINDRIDKFQIKNFSALLNFDPKENFYIFMLSVLFFILLFIFRFIDDNKLVPWSQVFSDNSIYFFIILLFSLYLVNIFLNIFHKIHKGINEKLFFLLIPFLFLFLFFFDIPELNIDSARYITQAKYVKEFGVFYFIREWGKDIFIWTDMPLVPFIYGIIFKLFGEERVFIQIFNSISFTCSILLTYLLGKSLWNREVGFYAGIMLLSIPYLYTQIPLTLVDIPAMSFFLLALYSLLKAITKGEKWLLFSPFTLLLSILTKYSLIIWFFGLFIALFFYILAQTQEKKLYLKRLFFVIGFLLFLIILITFSKYNELSYQLLLLLHYQKTNLKNWNENYISTFFYQSHPFLFFLFLYSLKSAFKNKELFFIILLLPFILIFLLQIERIRYIIPILPLYVLMASYGLYCLPIPLKAKNYLITSILIFSFLLAFLCYRPFLKQTNMATLCLASDYINKLPVDTVKVLIIPSSFTPINLEVLISILDLYIKNKHIIYEDSYYQKLKTAIKTFVPNESPFRFSWEFTLPIFYKSTFHKYRKMCFLIISDSINKDYVRNNIQKILEEHPEFKNFIHKNRYKIKSFSILDGTFTFQLAIFLIHEF
jgi:hypothetical protein